MAHPVAPRAPVNNVRLVASPGHIFDGEVEGTAVSHGHSNDAQVYAFLGQFKVYAGGELMPFEPNNIIEVWTTETVYDAFSKLIRYNVLAAPVYNPAEDKYTGLIDMVDLATLAMKIFDRAALTDLSSLRTAGGSDSFTGTVESASNLSGFDPYIPVPNGTDLLSVLRLLGERGLRRVCMVDPSQRVMGVVSQSLILSWLHENKAHLGHDMRKTIEALGFVCGPELVVTVTESTLAAEAFKKMIDTGVTSVGIVSDESGELLTALSVRDLKVLRQMTDDGPQFNFAPMFETVMSFVSMSRMMTLVDKAPIVHVHASATLAEVIDKLAATHLHRLFVTDDDRKPIGVISLGDVIRAIPTRP